MSVVEYFDGTTWIPTEQQTLTPAVCIPNDVWTVNFQAVEAQKIRVVFENNLEQGTFVGITELEIWAPWPHQSESGVERYEAEDGYLTGDCEITASSTASEGSFVDKVVGDATLEFTGVWVDKKESYSLSLRYANEGNAAVVGSVEVNNLRNVAVTFPPTSTGSWPTVRVETELLRGNNVLIFKGGENNGIQIDALEVLTPLVN